MAKIKSDILDRHYRGAYSIKENRMSESLNLVPEVHDAYRDFLIFKHNFNTDKYFQKDKIERQLNKIKREFEALLYISDKHFESVKECKNGL